MASWNAVRSAADVPFVAENAVRGSDALAYGYSRLNCYQPMFGYRLEHFIVGNVRPGGVLAQVGPSSLNFKNPACYLFPAENKCAQGGEFSLTQRNEL